MYISRIKKTKTKITELQYQCLSIGMYFILFFYVSLLILDFYFKYKKNIIFEFAIIVSFIYFQYIVVKKFRKQKKLINTFIKVGKIFSLLYTFLSVVSIARNPNSFVFFWIFTIPVMSYISFNLKQVVVIFTTYLSSSVLLRYFFIKLNLQTSQSMVENIIYHKIHTLIIFVFSFAIFLFFLYYLHMIKKQMFFYLYFIGKLKIKQSLKKRKRKKNN